MNSLKQSTQPTKKVPEKKETVTSLIEPVQALEVFDPKTDSLVPSTSEELKKSFYKHVIIPEESDTGWNVVYQVVFPDDLNLKPTTGFQKSRGRPKKPKIQVETTPASQKTKIKVVSKTRSGRAVKFPKYIENEFKKIEINDDLPPNSTDADVKISDFVKYSEEGEKKKADTQSKLIEQPDIQQKKRKISAHYRCPKCKKAYLGRNKILDHLKKNPSHGPMHQNEENNFEVWNYLVSVTQKCPSSERGQKFCQELSNLLHNLLLLTNALFKNLGSAANEVKIDQVLGNAIGLTPGNYYFDDNSLYKNVTVLKLMANNDFLHSIKSKSDDNLKTTVLAGTNCNCGKRTNVDELELKSMLISPETNNIVEKPANLNKPLTPTLLDNGPSDKSKNNTQNIDTGDVFLAKSDVTSQPNFLADNKYQVKTNLLDDLSVINVVNNDTNWKQNSTSKTINIDCNKKESMQTQHLSKNSGDCDGEHNTFSENVFFSSDINLANNFSGSDYKMKQPDNDQANISNNLDTKELIYRSSSLKFKTQSNILTICSPKLTQKNVNLSKSSVGQNIHNKNLISSELMTDNSVLIPLANLRQSDDELMLPVPSETSNILDTSSSSDEVMNVDQFVNERFRKITESDLEANGSSLNLELPSLDLFQFHPS